MVSAVEIGGSSRGILAWEAELTITKTVSGASSTFYYRSMDKYQEPFTMPASFSGVLETQRGTIDLTETVINSHGTVLGHRRGAELDGQGCPVRHSQGVRRYLI
ncbi:Prophage PssSM-02, GDSL-like lipase [Pseudomonas amygdali]|nr:Prophage PssSM-02, GDSL-like lipase [Pseudomonas amygdali]